MERPRVLVVEDRPSVLTLMATILESWYEVVTASSGAAALSLIDSTPFDVVLTDIRMPGISGFDVLRAVQGRKLATGVVMMTAYANVPDAVAAMKLGAYDYVAKPLDADEITLVVARAVEHVREAQADPSAPPAVDRGSADESSELSMGFHRAVEEARDRASREYLTKLLRLFDGNVTQAAKRARMTRESLHRVMKKYDVRAEHPRDASAGEQPKAAGPGGALSGTG
jgi:DNA-binding NtrC family response regulator